MISWDGKYFPQAEILPMERSYYLSNTEPDVPTPTPEIELSETILFLHVLVIFQ